MLAKTSHGQTTTGAILDHALRLFARHGYAAVSMRQIAQGVGLNVGAIYNHFPSKQAILVDLMAGHMTDLLTAWADHPKAETPAAQLESFVRFHISYNIDKRDAVFISFMELRALEPAGRDQIEALRHAYEQSVRDTIAKGAAKGEFQIEDAHVAAMSVLGSLVGVNTWFRDTGRLTRQQIEDFYVAMILRSVGYKGDVHV